MPLDWWWPIRSFNSWSERSWGVGAGWGPTHVLVIALPRHTEQLGHAGDGVVCLLFVDQLVDHLLVSSGEESRGFAQDLAFLAQLGVLTAQPGQFGLVVAGGALLPAGVDLGLPDPVADGLR